MAEIRWTREAQQWLRDIYDFIAIDNPDAALRTVEAIHAKTQDLKDFPNLGYRYPLYAGRNVRILLYGHYRIAYHIKEDGSIDILGVFHQALDIERYLF